jgi:phage terminase Nu1 subunit (DNA packaging protein)
MAFMDLHNGHVDLIKEIQTALTKRAKLWDHEPALVYTGQSEKS